MCLHYADLRSRFADVTNRRVADATPTSAKAPGCNASTDRRLPIEGEMVYRDVLRAGGLLGLTVKEMFR